MPNLKNNEPRPKFTGSYKKESVYRTKLVTRMGFNAVRFGTRAGAVRIRSFFWASGFSLSLQTIAPVMVLYLLESVTKIQIKGRLGSVA